jgi:hypothetical protein
VGPLHDKEETAQSYSVVEKWRRGAGPLRHWPWVLAPVLGGCHPGRPTFAPGVDGRGEHCAEREAEASAVSGRVVAP